jgi:hypothetical protein
MILWSKGLPQILLNASSKFVWELYTIFNGITKATHLRSIVLYRLKMIARVRSINDGSLRRYPTRQRLTLSIRNGPCIEQQSIVLRARAARTLYGCNIYRIPFYTRTMC